MVIDKGNLFRLLATVIDEGNSISVVRNTIKHKFACHKAAYLHNRPKQSSATAVKHFENLFSDAN